MTDLLLNIGLKNLQILISKSILVTNNFVNVKGQNKNARLSVDAF